MAKIENNLAYLKLEFDDLDALWESLTPAEYGQVIHSLHVFMQAGIDPDPPLEGVACGMYFAYKPKQARAKAKYEELCQTRAQNGAKGGKAKSRNAKARGEGAIPKFTPPTLKQFKNAVDHLVETNVLDEDDFNDYDVESFFSDLQESGWKIGSIPIQSRAEWENAISAKFYLPNDSPKCFYEIFAHVFSTCDQERSEGVGKVDDLASRIFWAYDDTKDGWNINGHIYPESEWRAATDAYIKHMDSKTEEGLANVANASKRSKSSYENII